MKMKSMKTMFFTSDAARPFCAARAPSSSCPHPGRVGFGLKSQIAKFEFMASSMLCDGVARLDDGRAASPVFRPLSWVVRGEWRRGSERG
jgi:hypothetical protein